MWYSYLLSAHPTAQPLRSWLPEPRQSASTARWKITLYEPYEPVPVLMEMAPPLCRADGDAEVFD